MARGHRGGAGKGSSPRPRERSGANRGRAWRQRAARPCRCGTARSARPRGARGHASASGQSSRRCSRPEIADPTSDLWARRRLPAPVRSGRRILRSCRAATSSPASSSSFRGDGSLSCSTLSPHARRGGPFAESQEKPAELRVLSPDRELPAHPRGELARLDRSAAGRRLRRRLSMSSRVRPQGPRSSTVSRRHGTPAS
jgi:hypothetical protein